MYDPHVDVITYHLSYIDSLCNFLIICPHLSSLLRLELLASNIIKNLPLMVRLWYIKYKDWNRNTFILMITMKVLVIKLTPWLFVFTKSKCLSTVPGRSVAHGAFGFSLQGYPYLWVILDLSSLAARPFTHLAICG